MSGTLYGVGVGPGDPENMTYKAVKCIIDADVIAVPCKNKDDSVAYKIAAGLVKDLDKKPLLEIDMPMTKDKIKLEEAFKAGADMIEQCLKAGKNVAFVILGDPCIYGTYIYIYKEIERRGYNTAIINGITSFCAVSARLNDSLSEKDEMLHIIPASYEIHDALRLPGSKILMKAGKQMKAVKEELRAYISECEKSNKTVSVKMVENCSMANERVFECVEDIPEDSGYFSIIIVKEHLKQ